MSERATHVLDHEIDLARRAVSDAIVQLEKLRIVLDGDNPPNKIAELLRLARVIGYSNSIGTAWAELAAAAGAVSALVDAGVTE